MALIDYGRRITCLNLHVNRKLDVRDIADAMGITADEVQECLDIGEDYLGRPEYPRRRPAPKASDTATTAPETPAPRTRARTSSSEAKPDKPAKTTPPAAEDDFQIEPPPRRGEESEREGFAPGQAA